MMMPGERRGDGILLTVDYSVRLPDGKELDGRRGMTLELGARMVAPELDHLLRGVAVGSEASLEMPAAGAIGALRCDKLCLDRKSPVTVWVRVTDAPLSGATAEACSLLQAALKYKEEGNDLYREKCPERALGRYKKASRALRRARDRRPPGAERAEDAPLSAAEASVHLNIAACRLNMAEPDLQGAVAACNRVLSIDAGSVKALFRRGTALGRMGQTSEALADMIAASKLDPSNKEAVREAGRLKQAAERESREQGRVYAKMFG